MRPVVWVAVEPPEGALWGPWGVFAAVFLLLTSVGFTVEAMSW